MERDDDGAGMADDRLSALMAGILLAANVVGGGILALLKALDVPPMVASPEEPRRSSTGHPGSGPAGPHRVDRGPGVARQVPADPAPRRR